MELALVIGAFVAITALIALCTLWFFHLHRRYLIVADNYMVPTATEDEHYSPAHLFITPGVSGENRGKKLLLSTNMMDDEVVRSQRAAPNGRKPQKKECGRSQRNGVEQAEQNPEGGLSRLTVQQGAEKQLRTDEQPRAEEQLKTDEQPRTEEQLKTDLQPRIEEHQGTEDIDRHAEKGGGETEHLVDPSDCFQAEEESEERVFVRKVNDGAVEKPEVMCVQPSPVEAA
ncbi:MAG: hypothetical protein GX770_09100, partial [Firmicutes bacterium]|nr:hypothetical protein [Bacillota bacterium]